MHSILQILFFLLSVIYLSDAGAPYLSDARAPKPKDPLKFIKDWGYHHPERYVLPPDWEVLFPICGSGLQQSPIDLITEETEYDSRLAPIKIIDKTPGVPELWNLTNNGRLATFIPLNKKFSWTIQPENDEHVLAEIHLHWRGSEHHLNGKRYSAEAHAVFLNSRKEVSVIPFFIIPSKGDFDNRGFKPITDNLPNVDSFKTSFVLNQFKLSNLIPFTMPYYYRYHGSRTVPPCEETFEFFIPDGVFLAMSEAQLLACQSIEDVHGDLLITTARPLQDLNGRVVRRSFRIDEPAYNEYYRN